MITWGHNCQQGGPHALTGGPSVQVQFPHLKISTLTTATATLRISVTYLAYIAETYNWQLHEYVEIIRLYNNVPDDGRTDRHDRCYNGA